MTSIYTLFYYYVNVSATVICRCMGNVKWLAPIAVNTLPTVHHQEITNQVASLISFSLITNATGDNARIVAMPKSARYVSVYIFDTG